MRFAHHDTHAVHSALCSLRAGNYAFYISYTALCSFRCAVCTLRTVSVAQGALSAWRVVSGIWHLCFSGLPAATSPSLCVISSTDFTKTNIRFQFDRANLSPLLPGTPPPPPNDAAAANWRSFSA